MIMKNALIVGGLILGTATMAIAQEPRRVIDVLKQASCGCCSGWVLRMQEAGFTVNVQNVSGDTLNDAKVASGFSDDLWACHTASVSGYTVEGHVPVKEITRLLTERPVALGIATPGMPTGSPGMEYGEQLEAYNVMLINLDNSIEVYASYPGN
tara:strand:- start:2818 stop:3279 length:462 start_codon:yes stop_codon:yes gene_type:complete